MITTEKEKFYDENIAPKLVEIGKLCQDNGISLIAVAEYDPPQVSQGLTVALDKDASLSMRMLHMLSRSLNNVDKFLFSLIRYLNENKIDHSSIFLAAHLKPLASEREESPKQEAPKTEGKQIRIAFIG